MRRLVVLLLAAAATLCACYSSGRPLACRLASAQRRPNFRATCHGMVGETIRVAAHHELELIAQLQLDGFVQVGEAPVLLPFLASLFEAHQLAARKAMKARLVDEIERRVARGSRMLVAVAPVDASTAVLAAAGATGDSVEYREPSSVVVLGAAELSSHELTLPTHALSGAMYVSHMVVDERVRRRGVGLRLLREAERLARQDPDSRGIYLHVERTNIAALQLYERSGYHPCPETLPFVGFTRALCLEARDPTLMYRPFDGAHDSAAAT